MVDNEKTLSADQVVAKLDMQPHPEGGWYKEMFRDPAALEGRSVGTAIYYLLEAGQRSHWHRVDASEVWHHYAGAPLLLRQSDGISIIEDRLGDDLLNGERPQAVVPAHVWQSAESLGQWTLVGCTVAPGFEFAGFEIAPEGWEPGR